MAHEMKKPHAGHGFHSTHIEHHPDGSATIHHIHEDGSDHDKKYAVLDLDSIHDGMEDHLGEPNEGEDAENHDHPSHAELTDEIACLMKKMADAERAEGE